MDKNFRDSDIENKLEENFRRRNQSNSTKFSTLRDFNRLEKEKENAVEISQREWVQEIRKWSEPDKMHQAQQAWISQFSSVVSFNTIKSPEKKGSGWTLPFSPPKSSYDQCSRRGYCIYEPGNKGSGYRNFMDNVSDDGKDIKVGVIEEPTKAVCNTTPEKAPIKSAFSPFPKLNVNMVDNSVKKRHITVRKKLHCQKKLEQNEVAKEQQNVETTPKAKPAGVSADRSEEDRRSARKFIQRKRVERERQLRQQKLEEERIEQEQRARMERLKETQHRIRSKSKKKPVKQSQRQKDWVDLCGRDSNEDKLASPEMSTIPEHSKQHTAGAIPFLSPRDSQHTPEKYLRDITHQSTVADMGWTQDENIPPPRQDTPVEGGVSDRPRLTGTELWSTFSLPSSTKVSSCDLLTPQRVDSLPLQKPETPTLSTTPIKKPSMTDSYMLRSSMESMSLNSKKNLFSAQPQASLFQDIELPVKLSNDQVKDEDLLKTISITTELQRKDNKLADEKASRLYDNHMVLLTSSENLSSKSEYNLLTAISNKRSALKEAEETRRTLCEKGVQCQSEEIASRESSTTTFGSYSGSSETKLTQSERLRKPNLILLPARVSDPCVYGRSSSPNLVLIGTTVSDNLSQAAAASAFTGSSKLLQDSTDPLPLMLNTSSLQIGAAFINKVRKVNIENETEGDRSKMDPIKVAVDKYAAQLECTQDLFKMNSDEDAEIVAKKGACSDVSFSAECELSIARSDSSNVQGDDGSYINFAKFSLNMLIDLLNEECVRSRQQESHLKMRENSIVDKTKAEIAYLELEKKKFKVMGNEEGVRNVKKKIRGLIMKLQQNLEDIQLAKKMEKTAYRGRRKLLLEKIDLLKDQLNKQGITERKAKKGLSKDSSTEVNKEAIKDYTLTSIETKSLDRRGFKSASLEKQNKNSDGSQECGHLNARDDSQECGSLWKQKLEDGQRRIRELEDLIKGSLLADEERKTVERGTSPLRSTSDDDKKKEDCSYSDTLDQLSTSSQHDKLEGRDARKMIALKVPLSPRITLKRRYSSGSEESLLLSQAETQSDASDMETRVLALQQQLKQRKAELESLHREYKKSQRERLIAKEQSLLSQIQAYDVYIEQVKTELEKEKDGCKVKAVKPVIKHPKLYSERRKSDTWLMHERSLRNIPAADLHPPGNQIEEVVKYNKFFDNKALEKFTLIMDFSSEVNSKQLVNDQLISHLKTDGGDISHYEELPSESEKRLTIKGDHHLKESMTALHPNDASNDSSQIVSDEERGLLRLIQSGSMENKEDVSSLQNSVDEKIEFYEKLNESSLWKVESSINATNNQSANSLLNNCSIEPSCKKGGPEERLITLADLSHAEDGDLNISLPFSKVESKRENLEISQVVKPHELMDQEGSLGSITVKQSYQKRELIKRSLGSASPKDSIENIVAQTRTILGSASLKNSIEDIITTRDQEGTDFCTSSLNNSAEDNTGANEQVETDFSSRSPQDSSEDNTRAKEPVETVFRSRSPQDSTEDNTRTKEEAQTASGTRSLNNSAEDNTGTKEQVEAVFRSRSPQDSTEDNTGTKEQVEAVFRSRSPEDSTEDNTGAKEPAETVFRSRSPQDSTGTKEEAQTASGTRSVKNSAEDNTGTKDQIETDSGSRSLKDITEDISTTKDQVETASELTSLLMCGIDDNIATKDQSSFIFTEVSDNLSKSGSLKEIFSGISNIDAKQSVSVNIRSITGNIVKEVSDLSEGSLSHTYSKNGEPSKSNLEQRVYDESSEVMSVNKATDAPQHSASSIGIVINEEIYSENVEAANETSEDVENMDDTTQKSMSMKESILEEVISVVDSEILSGASFCLPILGKDAQEPLDQNESLTERVSVVEENTNVESELENILSQIENEPSTTANNIDSVKSIPENIETDMSHTASSEDVRSEMEESDNINNNSLYNDSREVAQSSTEAGGAGTEEMEDSVDEDIMRVSWKSQLSEVGEDYDSEDSLIDTKDVYDLLKNGKTGAAPLIDALQREGDSTLDQIWRGIAEHMVKDATDLVIGTFISKSHKETCIPPQEIYDNAARESDDEEELRRQEAAEAEAEILRLQQLRIDKEIEELEEEEARRYYYIRPIPDKPPPPYTPRRSSLVASVVEAAGEIWDGRTEIPTSFMVGCHLRQFLWDLSAELVVRVRPVSAPTHLPWIHERKRRPKRHIRTKEELMEEVEKEAKIYLGVEERACRQNLIIRWSRKRRDHVDEILVRESQEEEWEWTDYSEEENIIKNRIADSLIQESLGVATSAIAQAFVNKFSD